MLGKFGKSQIIFSHRVERERTIFLVGVGLSIALVVFTIALINSKSAAHLQNAEASIGGSISQRPASNSTILLLTPEKTVLSGNKLTREMLREVAWPVGQIPVGAIKASDAFKVVYAKSDLVPGVPLLESNTSQVAPLSALSLTAGNRAVSIEVDETSSIEGHALPGTRVDLVLTGYQGQTLVSTVIVQNARVISSGGDTTQINEMPNAARPRFSRTVSLEVSPQDALKIQTARQMGRLGLMMRAQDDNSSFTTTQVSGNDIQGITSTAQVELPKTCDKGRMRMAGKDYIIGCDGKLSPVQ